MDVVDQRDAVALRFGERLRQHREGVGVAHGDARVKREGAQYGNFAPGQLAMIAVGDEQDALQFVFRKNWEAGERDDALGFEGAIEGLRVAESLIAEIVLRVEEALGADDEAHGADADVGRELPGGRRDHSFGRDGPHDRLIFIEPRQVGDVGADKAACATDDRAQEILQRQGAGEIVGRFVQQIEAAFGHSTFADDLGDGVQMKMQPLNVMADRSRGRRVAHHLDQFGDFRIVRPERRLFEDGRDDGKNVAGHGATPRSFQRDRIKPDGVRPEATSIDHRDVSSRRKCRSFVCESTTPPA